MTEPEKVSAEHIGSALRTRGWNDCRLSGQAFAVICPLCGAMVAVGAPPNGLTYQEMHIRDHEWATQR